MNATQKYFSEKDKQPYRNLETGKIQTLGVWKTIYPRDVFLKMYYGGDLVYATN
jgi:hypothetical protein